MRGDSRRDDAADCVALAARIASLGVAGLIPVAYAVRQEVAGRVARPLDPDPTRQAPDETRPPAVLARSVPPQMTEAVRAAALGSQQFVVGQTLNFALIVVTIVPDLPLLGLALVAALATAGAWWFDGLLDRLSRRSWFDPIALGAGLAAVAVAVGTVMVGLPEPPANSDTLAAESNRRPWLLHGSLHGALRDAIRARYHRYSPDPLHGPPWLDPLTGSAGGGRHGSGP